MALHGIERAGATALAGMLSANFQCAGVPFFAALNDHTPTHETLLGEI
jgi:hypothetical protein